MTDHNAAKTVSGLKVGDHVRPRAKHVATNHIGTITRLIDRETCPTCGHVTYRGKAIVRWADGREGLWSQTELLIVDNEV
jgi:hypothetical protein